jgi:phosphoribosylformylglycinamidine synthase
VPRVDVPTARRTFAAVHRAIHQRTVRACHDLSEGGLAVALAEMAFAGACGARIRLSDVPHSQGDSEADELDTVLLFSESASRFIAEVPVEKRAAFEAQFRDANVPFAQIGEVTDSGRVQIATSKGDGDQPPAERLIDLPIAVLKEAWQQPLRW